MVDQTVAFKAATCLDRSSAFYQVLTAPYRQLPRARTPSPPESISPEEAERRWSTVDWSRRSLTPPEPDSSDEEDTAPVTCSANYAELERLIYNPSGKWGWASGLAIDDAEILMRLGCESLAFVPWSMLMRTTVAGLMCSATIKQGTLGGRSVTYISKS